MRTFWQTIGGLLSQFIVAVYAAHFPQCTPLPVFSTL